MLYLVCTFMTIVIIFKIYLKLTCGIYNADVTLKGKVAIVTGSNKGIGFETAKDLAKRGAKVILACRDENRGQTACDQIRQETGNINVTYKNLDLASFKSVRQFANEILKSEQKLDILVNNAGTGNSGNVLTEDSLTVESQINHFGPFLLTNLLLPLLKKSAPSRIIVVSSVMHFFGKVDLSKIHLPQRIIIRNRTYSNTKLCNILFTKELSRQLEGTRVTVNCLHPGAVDTDIINGMFKYFRFLFKTVWEGSQTSIYLAVAPELENVSGQYFADCTIAKTSKAAQDSTVAKKLWEFSEAIVKL